MKVDYRTRPRRRLRYRAWIKGEDGAANRRCDLEDVSEGGARLRVGDGAEVPADFNLLFNENAPPRLCHVVWRNETEVGLRFDRPATRATSLKRPI